jgi:two-component system chemotaxis response regulator CheB
MPRDIVVVGGSAGALQPLMDLLGELPSSLPATFFVVIHTSPDTPGLLPTLLARRSALAVEYAVDGAPMAFGRVYVAPPDHHLILKNGSMAVTRGPRENGFRPAVDPLFRTAAACHGSRVVGVVLSGGLDDGTSGLAAIKERGGIAVVQHVEEALASGMPSSAIKNVAVDHVVPAAELAPVIARLVADGRTREEPVMPKAKSAPDPAERGTNGLKHDRQPGPPSAFTCPECGGALWEVTNGDLRRFACHVGHSYSPDALATSMAASLEAALWTALRALEENGAFLRRMQDRAADQGLGTIAEGYGAKARDVEARAEVVRSALVDDVLPKDAALLTGSPAPPRPQQTS